MKQEKIAEKSLRRAMKLLDTKNHHKASIMTTVWHTNIMVHRIKYKTHEQIDTNTWKEVSTI